MSKIVKKKITVDISNQRLQALYAGSVIYDFPCVTGDVKHPTPKGKFKVIKKERIYRSKTYDAQMNYALQITNTGIYIHESYNYSEHPDQQSFLAKAISDTTATSVSRMRAWFPSVQKAEVKVGNINLIGSHGCIRLAHSDAVKLFDWADVGSEVEVK
jgi:lipoprotein-anchoring transpeptidase ErfK/SrfK